MDGSIWHIFNKSVSQLSLTQAAVIGGVGSTSSAMSVLAVDGQSWLQLFTILCGAIGALLSVGLLILKFVQQRREMRRWRDQNEVEHAAMVLQHVDSAEDRQEIHAEIDELRHHCTLCGHSISGEKRNADVAKVV